jgi:hypothetical protein
MIAATVTAFLGKKVRVRSAKRLPPMDPLGRWERQGRMSVQGSHNLPRTER